MSDTSMPDMGQQAIADSLTPVPDTSNLSLSNSAPSLQPSGQPTGPDSGVNPAEQAPQMPTAPAKPSLWKTVLSGALQGLAAGASVNTRGMNGGSAFAAGAGAGANQVLNVQPQQKAALDQSKAETAFHYAQLQHIQRELNLAPDNKRDAYLSNAADTYTDMLKSGAVVPMSQPGDLLSAQQQLQQLHGKNPWAVYSIMPVRGDDGSFQYSAVQFPKAPTQEDLTLTTPDGKKVVVTRGTAADKIGMNFTNIVSKQLEAESKSDLADKNNDAAMDRQKVKGAQAAEHAANTIPAGAKLFKKDADALAKTEGTYSMFQDVLNDINGGKDVTGAKSVVALFNAIGLSATPLQGMGMRINQSTVSEHINARGLGGTLYQKLLSVKNGDVITPDQIKDYASIAATARRDAYTNKINEARNYGLDPSFLMPMGNGRGLDLNTAQIFLAAADGDKDKARKLAASKGWKF